MPVTLSKGSAVWHGTEREGCLTGRSWVGSVQQPICCDVEKCPRAAQRTHRPHEEGEGGSDFGEA